MGPSIRRSLLVILVPFIVCTWGIAAFLSYYNTQQNVEQILDAQLAQSGQVLLALSLHELAEQQFLSKNNKQTVENVERSLWKHDTETFNQFAFQIWLNNSTLSLKSENSPSSPLAEVRDGFTNHDFNNKSWRVYSTSSNNGNIRVYIAMQTNVQDLLPNLVLKTLLIPFLIGLPFFIYITWRSVSSSLRPLHSMSTELYHRKISDLSPMDETRLPKEFRPITAAINQLFLQMKAAFDIEKRFTSDAAHELRTPLAALKTHAEISLGADNEEEQQKALRKVVQGVNRATRLVEQLLTLARLDPDTGFTNIRRFDLFIAAENVLSDEASIAIDKNIEISLSGTRGKFVAANADAIGVLMRNLIDNAIRYTPRGGEVEVQISRHDDNILFRVSDSGPGIPEAERSKVFNRFYRSLGTKESGSGLGLSIVTRIVELHHLSISLHTSKMGGAQFDVVFPAKDSDGNNYIQNEAA